MTTKDDGGEKDVSIALVGQEFEPGMAGNLAIAELLGWDTTVEKKAVWHLVGFEMVKVKFCTDAVACVETFEEELGGHLGACQTGPNAWVALVACPYAVAVTKTFLKQSHALAAGLHHGLLAKSHMT